MRSILEIQNIGKKYKIQHLAGGYLSLRERLANSLKFERNQTEEFWALKNISFDVPVGSSIGIIGRNGAGKSTLLKILSRITPPSTGQIISRGRVASLLEVGTGFHPELTGRENIYFNGSLLGMKRREIDSKFDEIVSFSEVEKFLDTALKHYSSGMQLRLAFSVAAFLEPEILIIDEVLAVGDAEFQKKCLGKMEDVSKSGRTILFVSHNMEAVSALCSHTVVLDKGQLQMMAQTEAAVNHYLKRLSTEQRTFFKPEKTLGNKGISLKECSAEITAHSSKVFTNGTPIDIKFSLACTLTSKFSIYLFVFRDESLAFISSDLHNPVADKLIKTNTEFEVTFQIPAYLLNPGQIRIGLMMADYHGNTEQFFNEMDLLNFQVADDGVRRAGKYHLGWAGAVSPMLNVSFNSN